MFEIDKRNNRELPYQPYNFNASIFNDFLYREKEIINDYWTDNPYRVIFRRNDSKNQISDYSTIFYPVEEDITQGRLLKIFGKYYLALNQETIENPVYRKSDLVKCNVIIYTFSNGKEIVIPAHVIGLTDPYGDNSNAISVVSGNIEILTQHCELSESIGLNSTFYILGGKYKVTNTAWNDGIIHLFAEREVNSPPPEYELEINLKSAYAVDTTDTLTVTAKRIESGGSTDIVTNPTIIWESSDNSIISFIKNGLGVTDGTAIFHSIGVCEICAIWKEHNIIAKSLISVESAAVVKKFSEITYSGLAEIRAGGSAKQFTSNFYDESGNLTGFIDDGGNIVLVYGYEPIWSLDLPYPGQEGNVTITQTTGRTARVQASSNAPIGTNFFLKLDCSNGEYDTAYLNIDIINLW